jgi:hypothetical protein
VHVEVKVPNDDVVKKGDIPVLAPTEEVRVAVPFAVKPLIWKVSVTGVTDKTG